MLLWKKLQTCQPTTSMSSKPKEIQEHVLGECVAIHKDDSKLVANTDIFFKNHQNLSETANKITTIMTEVIKV